MRVFIAEADECCPPCCVFHADLSDCERAAGTPSKYYGHFHCAAEKKGRVTCKQNHSV